MDETKLKKIGSVIESASNSILIKIDDDKSFEENKKEIQIGKYLQVKEGNLDFVICVIQNIKVNENEKYIISTQPIGIFSDDKFQQGSASLPSPTEFAYIIAEDVMKNIFIKPPRPKDVDLVKTASKRGENPCPDFRVSSLLPLDT